MKWTTKNRYSVGALKLNNGKIKYFVQNNLTPFVGLRIYHSLEYAVDMLHLIEMGANDLDHSICSHNSIQWESAQLMIPDIGSWWNKVCLICKCFPTRITPEIGEFVEGDPAWSPWKKKRFEPPVPGFNLGDWLGDDEKGGETNDERK